jgi:hypothetical protein
MDAAPGAQQLVIARSEVHRACDLLIASTPEALQDSQTALERAVAALQEFRRGAAAPASGATSLARALRAEVFRAGRLLESLASFYQGWNRILGAMSGGYTASGAPAAVSRQGRICCRG